MLVGLQTKSLCVLFHLLVLARLSIINQEPVLIFKKGQLNLSFCKFLTWFHNCYWRYCWIFEFLIFTLLHILRITVCKFPKRMIHTILFITDFSGSVDTIIFYRTGNHLPQRFWFIGLFFTVDGCIDCVEGILNS